MNSFDTGNPIGERIDFTVNQHANILTLEQAPRSLRSDSSLTEFYILSSSLRFALIACLDKFD